MSDHNGTVVGWIQKQIIFMTGVTGYVGQALLYKLLKIGCYRIYVLIRPRKNLTAEQRLDRLLDLAIFAKLHIRDTTLRNKVIAVSCDSSVAGLNISEDDRLTLSNEVTVVIHGAASVRFDDPLKVAILTNIRITRDVLVLATRMKNLKAFHYISTAYSNCDQSLKPIEEKIYAPKMDWRLLITVAETLPCEEINSLEKKITGASPNTYIFTKHISESLVADFSNKIPIVISRPVIVISGWREPYPGWVCNFNSPLAFIYGVRMGVLRIIYGTGNPPLAYVSIDYVADLVITSAWLKATGNGCIDTTIYNTEYMSISPKRMESIAVEIDFKVPFRGAIWRQQVSYTGNSRNFFLGHLLLHFLPGILIDTLLYLMGRKPRLMKLYRISYMTSILLSPFSNREVSFNTQNTKFLSALIPEGERNEFPLDLPLDAGNSFMYEYALDSMKGLRILNGCSPDPSPDDFSAIKRATGSSWRLILAHAYLCKYGRYKNVQNAYKQMQQMLHCHSKSSNDQSYRNILSWEGRHNQFHGSVGLPKGGARGHGNPLPVVLYIHGESYEWNSGNSYDGSVLAAYGQLIVVTINFRLGILGFLKTGARNSAQGNFGLMDLVAGLHWLRENIPAFHGDPDRITVMGHGTGAALANFIAVSPVARELLHRVILLSGSGMSPWALQREPLTVKRKVAEQTGCHGDLVDEDLAPCLRLQPLSTLLAVRLDSPRFLAGFAPFVDGTVLPSSLDATGLYEISLQQQAAAATAHGFEFADFGGKELLLGLTSTESYLDLSAQDLEFGFNETRRDRILRTYVRNCYFYHLNEIFSTLKNEYTDWEKPVLNPLSVRDSTLEVLSDGHTAAPLIRVGYLNTLRGGKTYLLHFDHQSGERDFPQRSGSVRGEDVPYVLGLPLVDGHPYFSHNYTKQDGVVSKVVMQYISNFARRGDPNGFNRQRPPPIPSNQILSSNKDQETRDGDLPFWDTYDAINQLYLEIGAVSEMKNHYRGHKMSLWLNLIPQLHRPGVDDLNMRHHHFQEEGAQFYDGSVRPQSLSRPSYTTTTIATTMATSTASTPMPQLRDLSTTTECPPNVTGSAVSQNTQRAVNNNNSNNYNLFRKLASSHYQSYTTALTVTIAVGCFLLLLNILIFAGIYHQRDRRSDKKKDELIEIGSCSSSSGDIEAKHALAASAPLSSQKICSGSLVEMPLQEFKCSPPSGVKKPSCTHPPSYEPPPDPPRQVSSMSTMLPSPSVLEPPPPPKNQPPNCSQMSGGILRQQGVPQTPSCSKKRVQIQEISV